MTPDKQKLMEDIHRSYDRLWMLTDSMEYIPHIDTALLDEAKQALLAFGDCVELSLQASENKPIKRPGDWKEQATRDAIRQAADFLHLRVIR